MTTVHVNLLVCLFVDGSFSFLNKQHIYIYIYIYNTFFIIMIFIICGFKGNRKDTVVILGVPISKKGPALVTVHLGRVSWAGAMPIHMLVDAILESHHFGSQLFWGYGFRV